ncbi:ubiquinone/menaquinone biosynthesis methyltransferase [Hahella ganghwensis]|uniref:ubiquinone/menaquinone biosynthesis methyltransferase n=1 Tax=Hahella ganghwensis TaxID=286420 RepID=UPI00037EE1DB|nr:ubiquinone/menaquinone biosynthesis methyltransferase [Hahella ganghwensis]
MKKNAAEFETGNDDVFGRIASRYDVLCDLFSLGIHRLWKRKVALLISQEPWNELLDSASGTGDIVLKILNNKQLSDEHQIVASDICPNMLSLAREKLKEFKRHIEFELLDAHDMSSVESSSVDVYSMSLGLKICNREKAIAEAYRVLRPGGRLITLEASNIKFDWLHRAYLAYMSLCMPLIGWIATGGDGSAYKYLLQGVKDFPNAEGLRTEMENAGFHDVTFERMSLGIVAIHVARKPLE